MKIFALTKSEQRVVVLIMIALLAGTIAMHHRTLRKNVSSPLAAPAATVAPNREDDGAPPDEKP